MSTRIRLTAACLATAAALALTACGSGSTVTDKPKAKASADARSAGKGSAGKPSPTPEVAKVGDTIALTGSEAGSKLDVTIIKVADNAKSSVEGFAPDDGNRWMGVQFQLVNTGSKAYSDSPANGAQLVDSEGQQFGTTFTEITAGPAMSSSVKLKPGAKALGWITFELPKSAKASTVQFGMDSGFADQTGEWKLS